MPNNSAVVFGAGRIARGFVGHLLGLDGYSITFVDVDADLVKDLNATGQYTVHIMGAPEKSSVVGRVSAVLPDSPLLPQLLEAAEIVFVSVGGPNLSLVAKPLAAGLLDRLDRSDSKLNVIVCENWPAAGQTLKDALAAEWAQLGRTYPEGRIGIAESTIMRSAVDATEEQLALDPLAKQSQDYWSLPVDGDALVTEITGPKYVDPVSGFANALQRKLFTYNGGNATISYIGLLKGHELLSDAANDPEIVQLVRQYYTDINEAMVQTYHYDRQDQAEYAARALAKFQDRSIIDPLSRQVRDPLRKLSKGDRLVGSALFMSAAGVAPDTAALSIRAALEYRDPTDLSAVRMAELIETEGLREAFSRIAGIPSDDPLVDLVLSKSSAVAELSSAGQSKARLRQHAAKR
jgi:mannitol-1-phosphate 5-dehydrogenase